MTAEILDGKAASTAVKADLTERVARLAEQGVVPGLGTVLIGDDPGSHAYVGGKHKACAAVGVASFRHDLPADASREKVLGLLAGLNADPAVDGYPAPRSESRNCWCATRCPSPAPTWWCWAEARRSAARWRCC